MINKDVPRAVVLQVGDLQSVWGADLGWLECCVQGTDLHHRFRLSGLQKVKTRTAEEAFDPQPVERSEAHVVFVEVLQHAFSFRQDEPPAEVLAVVSAPFPQKPLSVTFPGRKQRGGSNGVAVTVAPNYHSHRWVIQKNTHTCTENWTGVK